MGYFSDSLDFEKFFAKDLWSNLKKDPKRLVLGVDPASTWAWNKVLGRDDDPLVDQMGGPYDGRVISYGHGNGGVYDRAQAAGIDTRAAAGNHDVAHLIAGSYALGGLGNLGGNVVGGESGGAQPNLWNQGFAGKTNFSTGIPTNGAPATGIPGIAGPVGGGTGASSAAGMSGGQWAKLGMGLAQSGQPQQQQQPPPQAPVRNMAQPTQVPTMGQRLSGGLGRVGEALFPVDPNTGMTPDQMKALRTNALMQMGLGMMGASSQGAGFGESLARGYGLASNNMQGAMQRAYENAMANRAETRATDREKRMDEQAERAQAHQQWLEEHTLNRETVLDDRAESDRQYRMEQDKLAQDRWKTEQDAMAKWRQDQIAARTQGDVPAGYRLKPDGNLEPIPGGPADPSGLAAKKGAQALRKEFRSLPSVKEYESVLPIIQTAKNAPDTPQGDLAMIYSVGKILDPDSVVREGELVLTQNAAPWVQKMIGQARSQLGQGGRLTPEMRAGLIEMLDQRVAASRQAYERDFEQYSQYAREATLNPELVVGLQHEGAPARGLGQGPAPVAPVRVNSPEEAMKLKPGTIFITPDGKRKVR